MDIARQLQDMTHPPTTNDRIDTTTRHGWKDALQAIHAGTTGIRTARTLHTYGF